MPTDWADPNPSRDQPAHARHPEPQSHRPAELNQPIAAHLMPARFPASAPSTQPPPTNKTPTYRPARQPGSQPPSAENADAATRRPAAKAGTGLEEGRTV